MIKLVHQKLNGIGIYVYNKKTHGRFPVISSHMNTVCMGANENIIEKHQGKKSI